MIAFFIFAMVITAYTESQLDKLAEYVEECNYDEAEEIAEKLSGGVFQLFLGGDMLTSFTESNNQTYGEQYICEAFSEYKDGYLDNSYIPLDATFYYQNKDFSELEDKYGQVGQNSEIDAQIDEIVEGLEKADATYHDYINKKNLFAEPDCFVLIVEYENYAGDISEYAVFTYDVYDDAFVLFDTCNTLDENAGVLQKWLSYCLYNELYNTDYNRLQEMINNGAFSNK